MIEFNPDFARQHGVIEAILFDRIKKIQYKNKDNFQNYYDDSYWVDLNVNIYNRFLYFLQRKDIDFALENLVRREVLKELNKDDITYYSIAEKHLNHI
jgi:hypothetical protein